MRVRFDKLTVIWTGAIIAITAGFLLLVTRTQINRLGELADEIQAERTAQVSDRQDVHVIEGLQREVDELTARCADLDKQIPKRDMFSTFMEDLARFTNARNLRSEGIQPGQPVRSAKIVAQPIEFSVRGPFQEVYGLIQDIERMPRLTQIENLKTEIDQDSLEDVCAKVSMKIFFQAS